MNEVTTTSAKRTQARQIRRGISWNAVNLVANKGMSILVRLLLARLLTPEHFGLIAMIVVFLGLVNIFVDFGLKNALIQRTRDASSLLRYDSAFWFLLGGGIGWTILFIAAGIPLMIWFYNEPQLGDLAMVMGVSILLHSLSILPEVRLTRRMRFKSLVIAEVCSTIAASGITIALAFAGAGVWALAIQQLAAAGLRTGLIWIFSGWRPRLRFSWQSLRDVVGFSGYMLGAQSVYFVRTNMDNIAIGIILGAPSLGVYMIAYMITEGMRAQISQIISRVMLPVYSRMQTRPEDIRPHYLAVTRAMTLVLFPFLLCFILYADQIIGAIFTAVWQDAALPAKILALGGMVFAISGPAPEVLQGIGQVRTLFRISALNICFVGVPLIWGLTYWYGLPGAAFAMTATFIGMRLFSLYALKKMIGVNLIDLVKVCLPAISLTILLILANEFALKERMAIWIATNFSLFGLLLKLEFRKRKT